MVSHMPTNADLVYAMYDARPTNYVFGGSRWGMNNTDCSGMVDGAFWKVFGISPYSLGTWTGAIWNSPELERIHFGTSPNLPWDIMQIGDVISTSCTSPTFSTGEGSHVGFYTGNPDAPFVSHFANGGPYVTAVNGVYGGREIYYGVQRYMPGSEDDMSASDVWEYDYKGTAPRGNMYNCMLGIYDNAQPHSFWEYSYKDTAPEGNMYNCIVHMYEKVQALEKAVGKLQGGGSATVSIDYDKLANAVADKIAKRMVS